MKFYQYSQMRILSLFLKYLHIWWSTIISPTFIVAQVTSGLQHASQVYTSDNSALMTGSSSLFANPAASGQQEEKWDFSLSASRIYNTDILSLSAIASVRLNNQRIGMLIGQYGIKGYYMSQFSLLYSRSIGSKSFIGIQSNISQFRIKDLGYKLGSDISIGLWHPISHRTIISAYLRNPLKLEIITPNTYKKMALGILFKISDRLHLFTEIDKIQDQEISLKPGIRFEAISMMQLFVSFKSAPAETSFGVHIIIREKMHTDIGMNVHPILGTTLTFSLGYLLNQ